MHIFRYFLKYSLDIYQYLCYNIYNKSGGADIAVMDNNKLYEVTCSICGRKYLSRRNRDGHCELCNKSATERAKESKKKNYDRIMIYVEKGKRNYIKSMADFAGMSVNEYINAALDKQLSKTFKAFRKAAAPEGNKGFFFFVDKFDENGKPDFNSLFIPDQDETDDDGSSN